MLLILFSIVSPIICIIVHLRVYGMFRAPFFLFLLASALGLAGASLVAAIPVPEAGALSDLAFALSGAGMAAAALQLIYSFRLAGDRLD